MTWRLASALLSLSFLPSIHAKITSPLFLLLFSIRGTWFFSVLLRLFYVHQSSLLLHLFSTTLLDFSDQNIYIYNLYQDIKIYNSSVSRNIFGTYLFLLNRVTFFLRYPFFYHHLGDSSSNIFVTPFNPFKLFAAYPLSRRGTSFQARSTVSFPVFSCFFSFPWLFIPERGPFLTINSLLSLPPCTTLLSLHFFLATRSVFLSHTRLYACSLALSAISLPTPHPPVTPARSSTASVSGWRGCRRDGEGGRGGRGRQGNVGEHVSLRRSRWSLREPEDRVA